MSQFDVFGEMAGQDLPATLQNGRHIVQRDAERHIPADVMAKLRMHAGDTFLDVGCGTGLNMVAAHDLGARVFGCDHPAVCERARQERGLEDATFYGGDFLQLEFGRDFSKILFRPLSNTSIPSCSTACCMPCPTWKRSTLSSTRP